MISTWTLHQSLRSNRCTALRSTMLKPNKHLVLLLHRIVDRSCAELKDVTTRLFPAVRIVQSTVEIASARRRVAQNVRKALLAFALRTEVGAAVHFQAVTRAREINFSAPHTVEESDALKRVVQSLRLEDPACALLTEVAAVALSRDVTSLPNLPRSFASSMVEERSVHTMAARKSHVDVRSIVPHMEVASVACWRVAIALPLEKCSCAEPMVVVPVGRVTRRRHRRCSGSSMINRISSTTWINSNQCSWTANKWMYRWINLRAYERFKLTCHWVDSLVFLLLQFGRMRSLGI
mmetsp:Transcript_5807/g.11624  ORF Transcript_5807/g.11624 Transcript_5807/m.11624 type:complete len:293 (-) Transcript_5807:97-975(-)